jgi:hypothetical protein
MCIVALLANPSVATMGYQDPDCTLDSLNKLYTGGSTASYIHFIIKRGGIGARLRL